MQHVEEVSALVGDIYDAALDHSRWPAVLGQIAAFVGGLSASLYSKDASSKTGALFFDDGTIDPRYAQLYFDKYIKLDPSITAHFFAEIDKPIATADIVAYEEFLQSRFYKEWAQPQGFIDHIATVLDKSATSVALFGVFRHDRDGVVDEETRRRMRLLAPHVRRAVLIGRVIESKNAEAGTFADVLEGLTAAMLLVDANGRIVHANGAGHAMLATGHMLRAAGGHLSAVDPKVDEMLREILIAAGSGDRALGIRGIALPLVAPGGERHVAHVLPLTSGARRRTGSAYAAVAALFVHKAALATVSPPEVIAKAFKLTPTELRVLLAVVEVGGVPEVSEALGIAETTVKFHLRRLFDKTGSHRQADLVKLVAGYCHPLLG